eukprot:366054-Pleurochrysis_carterae.AAC.2
MRSRPFRLRALSSGSRSAFAPRWCPCLCCLRRLTGLNVLRTASVRFPPEYVTEQVIAVIDLECICITQVGRLRRLSSCRPAPGLRRPCLSATGLLHVRRLIAEHHSGKSD